MAVTAAGFYFTHPIDVTALTGGTDTSVANDDWIIWLVYYANTRTIAFTDPTGWTQLRQTVGGTGTIEVWRYHWSTGNPTSWALTIGGSGDFTHATSVVRGIISTPTVISTTHETTSSPVLIDAITNPAIGNNDVALLLTGIDNGRVDLPPFPENSFSSSTTPNVCASFQRLTAAGAAPSYSLGMIVGSPTPTELFGLQVVLPDVSRAVWGVGMIRMGT